MSMDIKQHKAKRKWATVCGLGKDFCISTLGHSNVVLILNARELSPEEHGKQSRPGVAKHCGHNSF